MKIQLSTPVIQYISRTYHGRSCCFRFGGHKSGRISCSPCHDVLTNALLLKFYWVFSCKEPVLYVVYVYIMIINVYLIWIEIWILGLVELNYESQLLIFMCIANCYRGLFLRIQHSWFNTHSHICHIYLSLCKRPIKAKTWLNCRPVILYQGAVCSDCTTIFMASTIPYTFGPSVCLHDINRVHRVRTEIS